MFVTYSLCMPFHQISVQCQLDMRTSIPLVSADRDGCILHYWQSKNWSLVKHGIGKHKKKEFNLTGLKLGA